MEFNHRLHHRPSGLIPPFDFRLLLGSQYCQRRFKQPLPVPLNPLIASFVFSGVFVSHFVSLKILAMACVAVVAPIFRRRLREWNSTVRGEISSATATHFHASPHAIFSSTANSLAVSLKRLAALASFTAVEISPEVLTATKATDFFRVKAVFSKVGDRI